MQSVSSPGRDVTAEVIGDSGFAAATDVGYLGVTLKSKFNPIRHYVFGGSNYGAQIRISWINDHVLLVRCGNCEKLQGGNVLERQWHRITICYERSNIIEGSQDASCVAEKGVSINHP